MVHYFFYVIKFQNTLMCKWDFRKKKKKRKRDKASQWWKTTIYNQITSSK